MGIEFTKESLDLILDKREEMVTLAKELGFPIRKVSFDGFPVLSMDEFNEIRKMLGIETYKVTCFLSGNVEEKNYFIYRGVEFYHMVFRKELYNVDLQE